MIADLTEDYLEDATYCTNCNRPPVELIGQCEPFIMCGIEVGPREYGTYLWCPECGKKTVAYTNPQGAYKEWNEVINKGGQSNE